MHDKDKKRFLEDARDSLIKQAGGDRAKIPPFFVFTIVTEANRLTGRSTVLFTSYIKTLDDAQRADLHIAPSEDKSQ